MGVAVKKWGQKTRLAAELGISPAAVTKLAKQGMPIDDADAARRWRQANLARGRMRADPGPGPETLLRRAQALSELAGVALDKHQLELVVDDLRAAMREVPRSHRARLTVRFDLWGALIGPWAMSVMRYPHLHGHREGRLQDTAALEPQAAGHGQEREDELDPGEVAYALACGEARIT